jgi:hypothetical protein
MKGGEFTLSAVPKIRLSSFSGGTLSVIRSCHHESDASDGMMSTGDPTFEEPGVRGSLVTRRHKATGCAYHKIHAQGKDFPGTQQGKYHSSSDMPKQRSSLAKYVQSIRESPREIFNWRLFLTAFAFALGGCAKGT